MSPYDLAQRYLGVAEKPGEADHPLVRWWHSLCSIGESPDSIPWCSSFVNGICWELRRARSKSAAARSWLDVGVSVPREQATVGSDIVVLSRGSSPTAGHVGFFAGWDTDVEGDHARQVRVLGGNQGNRVTIASYPADRILGIRRV